MVGSPSRPDGPPRRKRRLLSQAVLWIIVPTTLLAIGLIVGAVLLYQQATTALVLERDRQLALISATRVSQSFDEQVSKLEAWTQSEDFATAFLAGSKPDLPEERSELLKIFNAGLVLVDVQGTVTATIPEAYRPLGGNIADKPYFTQIRAGAPAGFSQVTIDARTGQDMIVIAVPIMHEGQLQGAALGAIHLHNTAIGDPVRRLRVGDEGFAYLVDHAGRVIFHPDPDEIGADFSERPFIQDVINGGSGGLLWQNADGDPIVLGYAPVGEQGWGLIVRESRADVLAPARAYGLYGGALALLALVALAVLLWQGVRTVTTPVSSLSQQAHRLAQGQAVERVEPTGIEELDTLSEAFDRMASRVEAYRSGLRHYLRSITRSQEAERRRVALELHDETIQSLLAIERRIELLARRADGAVRSEELAELRQMVEGSLTEVRRITRDLRPMMLEDLGLVPALRALVGQAQEWEHPAPTVGLIHQGRCSELSQELELALYRITQEALANIRKHAQADEVEVQLRCDKTGVELIIADDGLGFESPSSLAELAQAGHYGLLGMQERVREFQGEFELKASPGWGTHLRIWLPLENTAA